MNGVDDGSAGGDLLGRVLDEVVHDILGVRVRLAVRLERGERAVRVLARTLYVSLHFYGVYAASVGAWRETYDLEEVGVEVRALDEVDDLGLDGVVGVAELSTACMITSSEGGLAGRAVLGGLHGKLGGGSPDGVAEGVEYGLHGTVSSSSLSDSTRQGGSPWTWWLLERSRGRLCARKRPWGVLTL